MAKIQLASGTLLVAYWLGRCPFTARDPGSIPGGGTKILYALWPTKQHIQLESNHYLLITA